MRLSALDGARYLAKQRQVAQPDLDHVISEPTIGGNTHGLNGGVVALVILVNLVHGGVQPVQPM